MPHKPKRPCSYPGCPELTAGRYCDRHQKETDAHYNRYGRDPETKRRYGAGWQRIRKVKIAQNPLCEMCLKENRATPTEEVHHILPLAKGGTHDMDNLMSLCTKCHSRITATEGGRWG